MIKVGIIDSGIDVLHSKFKNIKFINHCVVTNSENFVISNGHGTSVFDAIRKSILKNGKIEDVEFYNIKTFDTIDSITKKNVIKAIHYCIEKKIDIINLSIGLISDIPPKDLFDICSKAYEKGVILVAAADNTNRICYPSHFPFVFGVNAGIIDSYKEFGIVNNSHIEIIGKGSIQRLASLNGAYNFTVGTSYAAGHITGIIISIKQENFSATFETIKDLLIIKGKQNIKLINEIPKIASINKQSGYNKKKNIDAILEKYFSVDKKFGHIQNILLYPYSLKEFRGLDYFSDLCKFNITEIFDFPRLSIGKKNLIIQNKPVKLKWDIEDISTNIDTFVLGYPNELGIEINYKFYQNILEYALKNMINLYVFDPSVIYDIKNLEQSYNNFKGKIYHPQINNNDVMNLLSLQAFGKVEKPVLCIVGTSPQAGKFTLQLKLKKALGNEGYKVGWLSTEPQGELFGADFCFPFGYKSTVNIELSKWCVLLDVLIKGIEMYKSPDIIITGHQSKFLSFSKEFLSEEVIRNLLFMTGVKPDAIALVVNSNDNVNFIQRYFDTFKSYFQIPILFISLSRQKKEITITKDGLPPIVKNGLMDYDEYNKKTCELEKIFGIPVIDIFNKNSDSKIINSIESFF